MKMKHGIADAKKSAFFDSLFAELEKVPFGTLGKRDIECLLLGLMIDHDLVDASSNRKLANALCVNEQKLKAYLVDIRYKYHEDRKSENIREIIRVIFANAETKLVHEKNSFVFAIENPVLKIDFEQAMKDVGYYTDSSFNKEIVKVRDHALLAFLFRYNSSDDTYDMFSSLLGGTDSQSGDLLRVIHSRKPWIERGRDMMALVSEGMSAIALVKKVALLLLTGTLP